ncbi:MAG: hypothetical protein PHV99_01155 [Candidatus Pacebacteria bacterium]|nr:hypothetical protein [Candidatus Paceibacterota bacterium]
MVVFSLIKRSELEGAKRLDAEYYQPEYLDAVEKIKELSYQRLGDLCTKVTDGSHQTPEYQKSGVPFLMVKDVTEQQINFDGDISFITREFDKILKSCKPVVGDILLTKVGSVGISAVVPDSAPSFNIFVSLAVLKGVSDVDKYFLSTFLNSKFGRFQAIRSAKGISQPDLHLEDIRNFIVPNISVDQKEKIAALTLRAEKAFKNAKNLYIQAEEMLLEELGLADFEEKASGELWSVAKLSEVKTAGRIDAEYFQSRYEKLVEKLRAYKAKRLEDVIENVPARFDPTKEPDKEINYVELSNINAPIGVIDGASVVVSKETPSRAKRLLKANDVIVSSVEGSLEKVALVDKAQSGHVASTGFFQFRSKEILPEVLLVLAKSVVFRYQLEQRCAGTILTAVPKESIKEMLVPVLPDKVQQKIAEMVRESHVARAEAKRLLDEAKRKVEELIESNAK